MHPTECGDAGRVFVVWIKHYHALTWKLKPADIRGAHNTVKHSESEVCAVHGSKANVLPSYLLNVVQLWNKKLLTV